MFAAELLCFPSQAALEGLCGLWPHKEQHKTGFWVFPLSCPAPPSGMCPSVRSQPLSYLIKRARPTALCPLSRRSKAMPRGYKRLARDPVASVPDQAS